MSARRASSRPPDPCARPPRCIRRGRRTARSPCAVPRPADPVRRAAPARRGRGRGRASTRVRCRTPCRSARPAGSRSRSWGSPSPSRFHTTCRTWPARDSRSRKMGSCACSRVSNDTSVDRDVFDAGAALALLLGPLQVMIDHRPDRRQRLALNVAQLVPQLRRHRSPHNISGPANRTPLDALVGVGVALVFFLLPSPARRRSESRTLELRSRRPVVRRRFERVGRGVFPERFAGRIPALPGILTERAGRCRDRAARRVSRDPTRPACRTNGL